MVFRHHVFFDTPEVTEIVLPKVLQNFKKTANCTWWSKELNQKGFPFFPRNVQYQARLFFGKYISPKGPPSICLEFCDKMYVEKSQSVTLSVFLAL